MNQIAERNENLPMNEAEPFNPYSQYGEQASQRNIVGKLLKFSKGDYTAGENNDEIPVGTELIANMESLAVGWMKWADNKPEEQIMGLVKDAFQPPKRKDLDATDESDWEIDETGKPRDPWQFSNQLVLKVPGEGGQVYTFATSSRGGINAIGELCKIYGKAMRSKPNDFPVIILRVGSYMHSVKAYGRIKFPVFDVKTWASKAEFAEPQGELPIDPETGEVGGDGGKDVGPSKPRPTTKF